MIPASQLRLRRGDEGFGGEGREMHVAKLPLEIWIVVDRTRNDVVLTHARRMKRKENATNERGFDPAQFNTCIAIEPVAQGMCRPCR